jgi:hypothetical protein
MNDLALVEAAGPSTKQNRRIYFSVLLSSLVVTKNLFDVGRGLSGLLARNSVTPLYAPSTLLP